MTKKSSKLNSKLFVILKGFFLDKEYPATVLHKKGNLYWLMNITSKEDSAPVQFGFNNVQVAVETFFETFATYDYDRALINYSLATEEEVEVFHAKAKELGWLDVSQSQLSTSS